MNGISEARSAVGCRATPCCDGCRFCCWSWAVDAAELQKKPLRHCRHECRAGCALHATEEQPRICAAFKCRYLEGLPVHRPDTFQAMLLELDVEIGNFVPMIPASVPIHEAALLILKTRTILADIIVDQRWVTVPLPFDRQPDGSFRISADAIQAWNELCEEKS